MERIELRSQTRTTHGKQVKRLRDEGWIPAVLYGSDTQPTSLQLEERALSKVLHQAGSTMLIYLFVDQEAEARSVLARQIQHDALTGRLRHIDFYQVRLTQKVKTMPRLEFHGESPVVKAGIAVMIHNMNEIEVECLPTDLISSIPVDVSVLQTLNDNVLVGDLPVPKGVTILADPTEVVVSVVPIRAAVEEEVVEEKEAPAEAEAAD